MNRLNVYDVYRTDQYFNGKDGVFEKQAPNNTLFRERMYGKAPSFSEQSFHHRGISTDPRTKEVLNMQKAMEDFQIFDSDTDIKTKIKNFLRTKINIAAGDIIILIILLLLMIYAYMKSVAKLTAMETFILLNRLIPTK